MARRQSIGRSSYLGVLVVLAVISACEAPPVDEPSPPDATPRAHRRDLGQPPDLTPRSTELLHVISSDTSTGLPIPARVIITAAQGTPDVRFDIEPSTGMDVDGRTGIPIAPGVVGVPEGVLLIGGDGAFKVPQGTYDVLVTAGPEWEAFGQRVVIQDGVGANINASLLRSVDTTGWLAADMHIHTGRSYDSQVALDDRVISEVVAGVELLVSTDHNVLTDLQPVIDSLGYTEIAHGIIGDEFNFAEGHGGAYPMPYDAQMPFGGTVEYGLDWSTVKDITAVQAFPRIRSYWTNPAVTVNHPRLQPDLGYFTNMLEYGPNGWSPPQPLPSAGLFDGLEVLNGFQDDPASLAQLMRDWFFLLSSGYRVTALGNSDTHRMGYVKAGFPRSWLRFGTDDPAAVDGPALADAIKHGHAIASNGPFATLVIDNAQIGDVDTNTTGELSIKVAVDAPSWIDLTQVTMWMDGQQLAIYPISSGTRPRFQRTWKQAISMGDHWIIVEAEGENPLPPALIADSVTGEPVTPLVFTNPVYIDGDGDGKWTPQIANPDPGPLSPPPPPAAHYGTSGYRRVPIDCEPPLWTIPSRLGTP